MPRPPRSAASWTLALLAPLLCTALVAGPWVPPAWSTALRAHTFVPYFPFLVWMLLRFPPGPAALALALCAAASGALDLGFGEESPGTLLLGETMVLGGGAGVLWNRHLLRRLHAAQEALVATEAEKRVLAERGAFLVLASHELRTPTTALIGSAALLGEALARQDRGEDTRDRQKWASRVLLQEAERLATVVERVLQAAEGESLTEVPGLTRPPEK